MLMRGKGAAKRLLRAVDNTTTGGTAKEATRFRSKQLYNVRSIVEVRRALRATDAGTAATAAAAAAAAAAARVAQDRVDAARQVRTLEWLGAQTPAVHQLLRRKNAAAACHTDSRAARAMSTLRVPSPPSSAPSFQRRLMSTSSSSSSSSLSLAEADDERDDFLLGHGMAGRGKPVEGFFANLEFVRQKQAVMRIHKAMCT
jgi:hypothetical protein